VVAKHTKILGHYSIYPFATSEDSVMQPAQGGLAQLRHEAHDCLLLRRELHR